MIDTDFRAIRRRLRLSQAALGEMMGVSGRTIQRWESGKVEIPGPASLLMGIWIWQKTGKTDLGGDAYRACLGILQQRLPRSDASRMFAQVAEPEER